MEENKLTAPDLMIGDWVLCESIKEKFAKITEIYLTLNESPKRMVSLSVERKRYCVPIDEVEAIPLTKEMLENNGFVPREEDSYIYKEKTDDNDFNIVVDLLVPFLSHTEKNNNPKAIYRGEIKFVHQLQQAMRLCKIEKKIMI